MKEGRDTFLLENANGEIYGICLGCDFTAEHEWGINGLKRTFGIDPTRPAGIGRRTISKLPRDDDFSLINGTLVCLPCRQYLKDPERPVSWLQTPLSDEEFRSAWDEETFAIVPFSDRAKAFLRTLHAAFQHLDVAMWIGSASFSFKTAGLVIAIVSSIPVENLSKMHVADEDQDDLKKAASDTGISDRLAVANKRYYSLSPKWATRSTSHPVMFWLNPQEQRENNCGWFTVEELDMWIAGKGPITKEPSSHAL